MKLQTELKNAAPAPAPTPITLVLGGTGKTGRRVVERLAACGLPVRVGSRTADVPFEWGDRATWGPVLQGMTAVYITYYPDLAVPGAPDDIRAFTELAVRSGVHHLVLLSGRGEAEAQRCEQIVQNAGADWTLLRAGWFAQNFSEAFMHDLVLGGTVALPAGDMREPFVSVDDIADVAVAALTEPGHGGQLYELTGPQLLTFAEVVSTIARATGREITYVPVSVEDFVASLAAQGVPAEYTALLRYLFSEVLDGRNAYLADGVQRALGRAPQDFATYARVTAASGVWDR